MLLTSYFTGEIQESHQEAALKEQTMAQKLSVVLGLLFLCAGSGRAVRLLHDVDMDGGFTLGTKASAETEPLDPALDDDDDENEISHVEFEPELGSAPNAVAAAPFPAATVTAESSGTAPGPVMARNAAASGRSMKWWLPPSTMPSFPLFPNPGGIPGLPMPGMPFHTVGSWGTVPTPPGHQPAPPASGGNGNGNDPSTSGGTN
jgi:hypothetical protein